MRRIAIALSKGGVGKTTTAVNLAALQSLLFDPFIAEIDTARKIRDNWLQT